MAVSILYYPYTAAELNNVYNKLEKELFATTKDIGDDGKPAPKILVVAGVQGSGKTYMLNNTLLKQARYSNYVRLYLESFRELHPRYDEMRGLSVTDRYRSTETFIWELCDRILKYAYESHHNIIMETALDTKAFASLISGTALAHYQFDVHLIGCKLDFSHLSTIKRALDSLELGILERFVDIASIESSMENAEIILNAFETACMRVSGSQITMYERGFGALKNRKMLCSSRCDRINILTPYPFLNEEGVEIPVFEHAHHIERNETSELSCSYDSFTTVVNGLIDTPADRTEAWGEAYSSLARMRPFWKQVPPRLRNTLWSYIKKYPV